jgi:D-sedoheptulose 7-phosphate isomerase
MSDTPETEVGGAALSHAATYLHDASKVIADLSPEAIVAAIGALAETRDRDGTVWTFGNGGNATIAAHLALGLSLNAHRTGGTPLRACCLTSDSAVLTAAVNDFGPDQGLAAHLRLSARAGDAVVALSVSGASLNVLRAVEAANTLGVTTIGIVGSAASPLGRSCQHVIDLRCDDPGLAEDAAQVVVHALYCWFMKDEITQTETTTVGDDQRLPGREPTSGYGRLA